MNITKEKDLIANLRQQMNRLNGLTLSDSEWKRLFEQHIASPQMTIEDKTERIQKTEIVNITLDNGNSQNIKLIDKKNIHNLLLIPFRKVFRLIDSSMKHEAVPPD